MEKQVLTELGNADLYMPNSRVLKAYRKLEEYY